MESNDAKALPDPREAVAGEDRALFPRPYFALYHFQGGGGGGGKSDGSKTNFTLMEKLFNIPRLREGDEGRGREREGGDRLFLLWKNGGKRSGLPASRVG